MSLRLYDLLPEIYRTYDLAQGRPLEALMETLQQQYDAVEANIATLYDGWFVETCPQWTVPYIAALLGLKGLETAPANLPRQRARVGNAQLYRSRKGSMAVLARAAADASGWAAAASDSLDQLVCSQTLRAVRPALGGSARLSGAETATWSGTPFSTVARTASFRTSGDGPLGPGVARLALWRLQAYPLTGVNPAPGPAANSFFFSPLAVDTPLFSTPQTVSDLFQPVTPAEVPLGLSWRRLAGLVAACRAGQTAEAPFAIHLRDKTGWRRIGLDALAVMDLSDWPQPPSQVRWGPGPKDVATIEAAVDPERGRFMLAGPALEVAVDYAYGFGQDIGGGPYDRRASLSSLGAPVWAAVVGRDRPDQPAPPSGPGVYTRLEDALADWALTGRPGVIRIVDNASYEWPTDTVTLDRSALTVEAANGCRPCVVGDLVVSAEKSATRASLKLGGLWMKGRLAISGDVALEIVDTTLRSADAADALALPAGPVAPAPQLRVARSILTVPAPPMGLSEAVVEDSIVDGRRVRPVSTAEPMAALTPPLTVLRTTALGDADVAYWWGALPDRAIAPAAIGAIDVAWATAVGAASFGQPAYGRGLIRRAVARSVQPIAEPGAYHSTLQGQRLRNLEPVRDEFLPQQLSLHIAFAD